MAPTRPSVTRWRDDGEHRINAPESYAPPLPGAETRLAALSAKVRADLHALHAEYLRLVRFALSPSV